MRRLLLSVVVLIFCTTCHAQKSGKPLIDSFLQVLARTPADTNEVNILTKLADLNSTVDPDTGMSYGLRALELSEQLPWEHGIGKAYNVMGKCATYKSDFKQALEYWNKALHIFETIHYQKGVAKVQGNIGALYEYQGNYAQALESHFKSLKYSEEIDDKLTIGTSLGNIGSTYHYLKNYPKALEYYQKALKIFEQLNDRNNLAIYLGNIGNTYKDEQKFAEALTYELRALRENEGLGNNEGITRDLLNIGSIYSYQANYYQAMKTLFRALSISRQGNFKNMESKALGSVGEGLLLLIKDTTLKTLPDLTEFGLGKARAAYLASSIKYFKGSIEINEAIGNLNELQINYSELSEAQKMAGLASDALASKEKFILIKDSVFSMESQLKITNLETQRELELKDKQIELDRLAVAKKRNERGFFIAGIVLLLIVIGFVIRNIRLKSAKELSENKLNAFQARMNPHFIFNSLNSIQSLVLNNETINSIKYLSEFSKLMRQILDSSSKSKIFLKTEIQMLRSYIELEQLRFERFTYAINVADSVSEEGTQIPAMIIQPFVENAIIHGILPQKGNGVLTLSFTKEENCIVCTIDDNGIGRERSAELNKERAKEHSSQGVSIATNRLTLLDKRKGNINRVLYIDKKENGVATGTTVILQIPML